jgi:hypothetical protein
MHIEILVEERSMEEALKNLLLRMLPPENTYRIINFQGKPDLLHHLPNRLRGYASWITDDYRIIVLLDEDRQNCLALKEQLETFARQTGLSTKTSAGGARFQVLNRIVIEELEAWFLGDIDAIRCAYPRIPATLATTSKFRTPDSVAGGTWETLEKTMQRYGYFKGGYAKVEAARAISPYMDPNRNRSRSFQVFRDGLLAMT